MREDALRLSMLGVIPAFPSWWMIVIDGKCRISHPAAFIRRQKSVSSEYMKYRSSRKPALSIASRRASMKEPLVQSQATSRS
jgi:hypothetical protein